MGNCNRIEYFILMNLFTDEVGLFISQRLKQSCIFESLFSFIFEMV